ncbi:MAG TPA: O-antigen ligase family protein [Gaiellaceae bacterium]|jgi:O-antigen ligase
MILALAAAAAAGAGRGGTMLLAVGAVAAVIALAVAVALPPEHVFLGWLAVAPFIQGTVGSTGAGHALRVVVYSVPPLLFAFWTLTRRRAVELTFLDALPLLYLVLVIISARAGPGHPTKTQVYAIVGIAVAVYYFVAFGPTGRDIFPRVARVLLLTGCVSAMWVMISRAAGLNSSQNLYDPTASAARSAGTFGQPAVLGTFLGVVLVLALAILAWDGPPRLRRLSLIAIVLAIPALALTLTRGPLIGAGAVALLVLVTRARTRWVTILGVVLALTLVAASWGDISSTHLYKSRFANKSNVQIRVVIDHLSVNLAERKPVLGWGYGSFDVVKSRASFNPRPFTRDLVLFYTSHNTFLTILVETGLVGLCLLVLPWLVLARRMLASVRRGASQQWMLVAAPSMLAVWVIAAGTFDMRFFSLGAALPWLAAGLMRRIDLDQQTSEA